jgi:hypothetical protein
LHSRARLGGKRITSLFEAPFTVRQNHSQRGLLLGFRADARAAQLLNIMCTMTASLCDFELTGNWRLDLYVRH